MSNGFQVVVMGSGHKVAVCLYAQLVTGGTSALGKVLLLDCQSEKCQKQHLRLVSHSSSFLTPVPWTHSSSCNTLWGACFHP